MKAVFVQRGESVDFTPARDVAAGEVLVFGGLPGVVKTPVKAGALGALALTGVYDVEKDAVAVAAGDRLLLCNSYPAADEVTAQYFLFAALRQFQINPEVTTVHFYGEAGETIKGDLFRHFASVEEL